MKELIEPALLGAITAGMLTLMYLAVLATIRGPRS